MFIKFIDFKEEREILVRLEHVSRIDVRYAQRDEHTKTYWLLSLPRQSDDVESLRLYYLHLGGETYCVPSDAPREIVDEIEKLYRSALSAPLVPPPEAPPA